VRRRPTELLVVRMLGELAAEERDGRGELPADQDAANAPTR
jgi:hypothetical protein